MPTSYPASNDFFQTPAEPGTVPLGQRGQTTRNHTEHHRDLGDAVMEIQKSASLLTHDHSGTGERPTPKLLQANTHQNPDTDKSTSSLHHTLGRGSTQASPGNHYHRGPLGHHIQIGRNNDPAPTWRKGRHSIAGMSAIRNTDSRYADSSGSTGIRIKASGLYYIQAYANVYMTGGNESRFWVRAEVDYPASDPYNPNWSSGKWATSMGFEWSGGSGGGHQYPVSHNISYLPQGTLITLTLDVLDYDFRFYNCRLNATALFNIPGDPYRPNTQELDVL